MEREDAYPEETVELDEILEYSEEIVEKEQELRTAFDSILSSNITVEGFDELFEQISIALYGSVDDEDIEYVSTLFINLVAQVSIGRLKGLSEEGSEGTKLADLIRDFGIEYRLELSNMMNKRQRGEHGWTNIKSEKGFRSSSPVFHTEFIRSYTDRCRVSSSTNGMINLADHAVVQVLDSTDELGRDILDYLDEGAIEDLEEHVKKLAEEFEEYNEIETEEPTEEE